MLLSLDKSDVSFLHCEWLLGNLVTFIIDKCITGTTRYTSWPYIAGIDYSAPCITDTTSTAGTTSYTTWRHFADLWVPLACAVSFLLSICITGTTRYTSWPNIAGIDDPVTCITGTTSPTGTTPYTTWRHFADLWVPFSLCSLFPFNHMYNWYY